MSARKTILIIEEVTYDQLTLGPVCWINNQMSGQLDNRRRKCELDINTKIPVLYEPKPRYKIRMLTLNVGIKCSK